MVKDLELLKVDWSTKPGTRSTHPINMQRLFVKVVAKRNDPDMLNVNDFLRNEARKHYYFGIPEGWMGIDEVVDVVEEEEAVKQEGSL